MESYIIYVPSIVALISFIVNVLQMMHGKKRKSSIDAETVRSLIVEAEQIKSLDGAQKKEWVLNKLYRLFCSSGKSFDEETVGAVIDQEVAFSKVVNASDCTVVQHNSATPQSRFGI